MHVQTRVFSLEPRGIPLLAPQPRYLGPQPMQLSHFVAKPLQFARVSSEAGELLVALAERFKLLRLFSKLLVLRAEPGEGLLLNHY